MFKKNLSVQAQVGYRIPRGVFLAKLGGNVIGDGRCSVAQQCTHCLAPFFIVYKFLGSRVFSFRVGGEALLDVPVWGLRAVSFLSAVPACVY